MNFMVNTSGLSSYALTYLMPSGKMFVQANYSTSGVHLTLIFHPFRWLFTVLWDISSNNRTQLPDMPGQIVRVYPRECYAALDTC